MAAPRRPTVMRWAARRSCTRPSRPDGSKKLTEHFLLTTPELEFVRSCRGNANRREAIHDYLAKRAAIDCQRVEAARFEAGEPIGLQRWRRCAHLSSVMNAESRSFTFAAMLQGPTEIRPRPSRCGQCQEMADDERKSQLIAQEVIFQRSLKILGSGLRCPKRLSCREIRIPIAEKGKLTITDRESVRPGVRSSLNRTRAFGSRRPRCTDSSGNGCQTNDT